MPGIFIKLFIKFNISLSNLLSIVFKFIFFESRVLLMLFSVFVELTSLLFELKSFVFLLLF